MYTCDAGDGILISYFNEYQHCQFPKHNHKRFFTLSMVIFVSIWATYLLPNNIQFDPDNKVHGANMGHISGRQDPGGPHVDPMNFALWGEGTRVPRLHYDIWFWQISLNRKDKTLTPKCCHLSEIFFTDGTGSCKNKNFVGLSDCFWLRITKQPLWHKHR